MNIIFLLVQLSAFYFFTPIIRAQPSKYPLVYNPYILNLYNKPLPNSKNIQPIIYPVFAACPAESEEEKMMDANQSIDHKALFIRKFYTNGEKFEDMIRCERNFEFAVVINKEKYPFQMEFGFEVYFEKSVIPEGVENIEPSLFGSYGSIIGRSLTMDAPILSENRQLSFMWLKNMVLNYDDDLWNVISVTYALHQNADRINVQCNDNNLGKDYFKKENLDTYYSKDKQEQAFEEVKIPELSTCQSAPNGCLEKYNLLMPHHFQPSPWSTTSCSDLTSIPIWHEVNKKLLDYAEKFLTAISQITESRLIITSGVHGILSLPYNTQSGEEIESGDIYLDQANQKFPVPRIIYKIVTYQTHECNDEKYLCWFHMVIVIHNEPEFKKDARLCPRDKCEEWGWENIQYMNTSAKGNKYEHIYCCKMDKIMEGILDKEMGTYYRDDLNLKYFPVYNKGENDNDFKDKKNDFLKQMDALLSTSRS